MSQPQTRQQLYERIRSSSKDHVILDEMIRLGFWPEKGTLPQDPADEIRRRTELGKQLRSLAQQKRQTENVEALKQQVRRQRMAEARQRRQETRERRERERLQRAARWNELQSRTISWLGRDVSAGLRDESADREQLAAAGLPAVATPGELAEVMGVTVNELRFLAFNRRTSTVNHYQRFLLPKKSGGHRMIAAPMPRLKRLQTWLLENVLGKVSLHEAAHGFRSGRSIVTNAQPHVGAHLIVNMDLEDFFPTVTFPRIKGVFRKLGYSESVATIWALLCSEPDQEQVELDGRKYFVQLGQRYLPQGAPSSPQITNIICRGLDARLDKVAVKLGFIYTRYADDMTFSCRSSESGSDVGRLLRRVEHVVQDESFAVHPRKTRVLRRGSRQEVTGLVVNERLGVPRSVLRRFRATLRQIKLDGPAGKYWGSSDDVIASIEGFANFVAMVDSEKGAALQRDVRGLIEKHGRTDREWVQRHRWQPPAAEVSGSSLIDNAIGGIGERNAGENDEGEIIDAELIADPPQPSTDPAPPEFRRPPGAGNRPWWRFW